MDESFNWKPVECAEELGDLREHGKVENQVGCYVLDKLQGFAGARWSPANSKLQ